MQTSAVTASSSAAPFKQEMWVTNPEGESISALQAISLPCSDLRVRCEDRLCEVLDIETPFREGYAYVVVSFNAAISCHAAVEPGFFTFTLSPYISMRIGDGNNVIHVNQFHPAMQEAMLLVEDEGLKWVPLLSVDRSERLITAHYHGPKGKASIDIAV
jgi:hypothetical protein